MNFYNEKDPKAAVWLRELIRGNHIPKGVVCETPIEKLRPDDLRGFVQCHFFAGIGGWSLALRIAGVPDSEPLWTGSCPCQPFSVAGKGLAQADERHLWPAWFDLIKQREHRSIPIFGEQVEAAVRVGWLDGVCADLEGEGYAVGAVVLGAHSVGAPHIRQRLFWVAHSTSGGCREQRNAPQPGSSGHFDSGCSPCDERLAHADSEQVDAADAQGFHTEPGSDCGIGGMENARPQQQGRCVYGPRESTESNKERASDQSGGSSDDGDQRMGEPIRTRLEGHAGNGNNGHEPGWIAANEAGPITTPSGTGDGFWGRFDLVPCRDEKVRRVEPGTFPLAHGFPARVDLLRGYGNAINPYTAAQFIIAYREEIEKAARPK